MATVTSIVLTVIAAYFFFVAGMNYMAAYNTGALIPFRSATLKAGAVGFVALVLVHVLYYVK